MAPVIRGSLALLAIASTGSAQDVNLRTLFLMPSQNQDSDSQTSVMRFSSSSVMDMDGQMHMETHEVTTDTSMDGSQKRVSSVDCKDGDCSQSESIMGRGPAFLSSMVSSDLFNLMPSMPSMPDMPSMPSMPSFEMPNMPRMHSIDMPGMEHIKHMMERMDGMRHRMIHHMRPTRYIHFLAPRMQPEGDSVQILIPITDEAPPVENVEYSGLPESDMGVLSLGLLVPSQQGVPSEQASITEALDNLAMRIPTLEDKAARPGQVHLRLGVASVAALALIGTAFTVIMTVRSCCFGKAQAREQPLKELGVPLAPEAEAELGMATGVVVRPQAIAVPAKGPATNATQAYLMNVYTRAGKHEASELATIVLRDVYTNATANALAATA